MKNAKKLLALLLALVMLFAFCACSNDKDDDKDDKKEGSSQSDKNDKEDNDDDKNDKNDKDDKDDKLTASKLEGEWEATLDFAAIATMMGEDISIFDQLGISIGKCKLDITFEDGEATIDMGGMIDWYVDMMEDVIDWCYEGDNMLEFVAASMSADGDEEYTAEDIENMLAEEGVSVDDLLDQYFGELDLDELADLMAAELEDEVLEYELDGDELIFEDDSIWTLSYSNGKIYVTSIDEDGEVTKLSKGDFVLEK